MGTCGELLTQLDRGGANRLKGFGIARLLGHACSETGETRQTADRQWRQRVLLYAGERAMTSENATTFEETPEVGDGGRPAGGLLKSLSRCESRPGHQATVPRGCGQTGVGQERGRVGREGRNGGAPDA